MIVLSGYKGSADLIRFSPDGTKIVAGSSHSSRLAVWNELQHDQPTHISVQGRVDAIEFSLRHPHVFVIANQEVRIRSASTFDAISDTFQSHCQHLVLIDDELLLIAGRLSPYTVGSRIELLTVENFLKNSPVWIDDPNEWPGHVWSMTLLPGRATFAAAVYVGNYPNHHPRIMIRNIRSGEVVDHCERPTPPWSKLIATDNLLVEAAKTNLTIWPEADIAKPPIEIKNDNRKHFTGIAFHPSGRYLAATSNDATVKLYDTDTWAVAKTFTWNVGKLRSVAFSPDGTLAAVGSDSGKIVVWDVDV